MFCRKCGKEVGDSDAFCPACGYAASAALAASPRPASTSAVKVAVGVFFGILAVIIVLAVYANVDGVFLLCALLGVLAIMVAAGAFRKQTR